MLLFTPALCGGRDPLGVLEASLASVDVVQVRPKPLGDAPGPASAREAFDWTRRILALDALRRSRALVLVDDRLDVARALWDEGCAGAHVGEHDTPPDVARAFLGPDPLLGLSTHTFADVVAANELALDYLGFGPVHATGTKGYARGLGAEACWIASLASTRPLFPIGGIAPENAHELARVGRAAVGSAILAAPDPARAAREIAEALAGED